MGTLSQIHVKGEQLEYIAQVEGRRFVYEADALSAIAEAKRQGAGRRGRRARR